MRQWRFRRATRRALAGGHHTALLTIDALCEVAPFERVLRAGVPPSGLVSRTGESEFVVLLPHLAFPEQAYDVAGGIASSLSPVIVEGRLVALAAAIGVAVSAPGELSYDELADRSRQAMHRARQVGPETRWAVWQDVSRRSAA